MKVLFLYLKAFSETGGIEKFNRNFLKALHELSVDGIFDADACSPYDTAPDEKYFPRKRFTGYGGNRPFFVLGAFFQALKYDVLIVGHINLGVVGYWVKKIKPSIKLVVLAHGIEVWTEQTGFKKKLLESADLILAVSNFTKEKISEYNPAIDEDKIKVFPNTIDPYFSLPRVFDRPTYLLKRYNLDINTKILLTVTRLSFKEKYKGYDNVIQSLSEVNKKYPNLRYLLCGRFDKYEKLRIEFLLNKYEVSHLVIVPGFISDEELIDHYLLADVFVMPSKKEGFGIVFIEAIACGRKVIGGSKDGSVDALMNGQLGKLVDPDSFDELKEAIYGSLDVSIDTDAEMLQRKVVNEFGFQEYKKRLQTVCGKMTQRV
jgi:glycosyltransferase involved in cell wall biosynthesis